MSPPSRSVDWRIPAIWAVLLTVSVFAHAHVEIANETARGVRMPYATALAIQIASHLVVAALLPAIYWLHRRWPIGEQPRNLLIHIAAVVPFSIAHTVGMAALRFLWFGGVLGESHSFPLTFDRMLYEFAKDIIAYGLLSAGAVALRHVLARPAAPAIAEAIATAEPLASEPLPERFAVRRKGREVMVEVADIDWIEASGNYAVLHVGDETFEIRSSLTKLESELDPKRFVRVHKSHVVNIARVVEVTPWVNGDWRIRLQSGAEVNLSRRYRQRFEALAPVRA
ncbi:LytR/AlgR family response regulator transcription factor [Reyranella sp.]|uniref:LytR/AlgR family response regulator transcription factor n=1 Tax=Reyranella sp. TaxID=1929291 RepID=UPI003BAC2BF5